MCVEKLITDKNTADIYSVEFKRFIKRHDLTSVQPYNSDEAEHLWISLLSNNKICTYILVMHTKEIYVRAQI